MSVENILARVRALLVTKTLDAEVSAHGNNVVIKCNSGQQKDIVEDVMIRAKLKVRDADGIFVVVTGEADENLVDTIIRGRASNRSEVSIKL